LVTHGSRTNPSTGSATTDAGGGSLALGVAHGVVVVEPVAV
jgi:hypothetical protein